MDINEAIFAILIVPIIFIGLGIGFGIFFASMTGKKRAIPIGILCSIVVCVLYFYEPKIPFYYLNPAYYKYQSECKKMPKPVIYDEDIWEIANNWDNLPKTTDKEGERFYYSKKLKKRFYGSRDWEVKRIFEKTWWGEVTKINDFYENKLFSTRIVYYYDVLVFRFGVEKISFGMEYVSCTNAKKVLF